MKEILTSKRQVILVDDDDFVYLNQFKWYINTNGYAVRTLWIGGKERKKKIIKMHREVMKVADPKLTVDHLLGNRVDNQKINLEVKTKQQNALNRTKILGLSGIKGVRQRKCGKWEARITVAYTTYRSLHNTVEEAIVSRNEMALRYHGENINPSKLPD